MDQSEQMSRLLEDNKSALRKQEERSQQDLDQEDADNKPQPKRKVKNMSIPKNTKDVKTQKKEKKAAQKAKTLEKDEDENENNEEKENLPDQDQQREALNYSKLGDEAYSKHNKTGYNEAIKKYNKAIAHDPSNAFFYNNIAACYFNLQSFQKCLENCEKALKKDNKIAEAWIRKAISYAFLNEIQVESRRDYSEAISCIEEAIEVNSGVEKYLDGPNWAQNAGKNKKDAFRNMKNKDYCYYRKEIGKILAMCQDPITAKIKWMEMLLKAGITDEARRISKDFENELSDHPEFLYVQGLAFYCHTQVDRALDCLSKARNLDSNNKELKDAVLRIKKQLEEQQNQKLNEGNEAFIKKDYNAALNHYSEGISLGPFTKLPVGELYEKKALTLFTLKNYPETIESYNKVIEMGQSSLKTFYWRGKASMEIGHWKDAVEDFTTIYNKDFSTFERLPDAYLLKGIALLKIGRCNSALKDFDTAFQKDPSGFQRFPEAEELREKARQMNEIYFRKEKEKRMQHYQGSYFPLEDYRESLERRHTNAFNSYNQGLEYDGRDSDPSFQEEKREYWREYWSKKKEGYY